MANVVARTTARTAQSRDLVVRGKLYDDKDAVVKANPSLFVTTDEWAELSKTPRSTADLAGRSMTSRPVEQATAAPGEKRSTRKPKKADTTEE